MFLFMYPDSEESHQAGLLLFLYCFKIFIRFIKDFFFLAFFKEAGSRLPNLNSSPTPLRVIWRDRGVHKLSVWRDKCRIMEKP